MKQELKLLHFIEKFISLLTDDNKRQTLKIENEKGTIVDEAYIIPRSHLHTIKEQVCNFNYLVLTENQYNELKTRAQDVFDEMSERMKAEVLIEKKMGQRKLERFISELEDALSNTYLVTDTDDCSVSGVSQGYAKEWVDSKLSDLKNKYGVNYND